MTNVTNIKSFLIYGTDIGLINNTIQEIKNSTIIIDDPFSYVELTNNHLAKNAMYLIEQSLSITITRNNILLYIYNPNTISLKIIQEWLNKYDGSTKLLVIFHETINISIKNLFEKRTDCSIIKCYPNLAFKKEQDILELIKLNNQDVNSDALKLLNNTLGNDYQITKSEIEKLITYHLPSKDKININEVKDCIVNSQLINIDDPIYNCINGNKEIQIYDYNPIIIFNGIMQHLCKLNNAINNKILPNDFIKKLKPLLHFSRQKDFLNQIKIWDHNKINIALNLLIKADKLAKINHLIAKEICIKTLYEISSLVSNNI